MQDLLGLIIRDDEGATAIEYGMIIGFMAMVLLSSFSILGDDFESLFAGVAAAFASMPQ
jgi:pilus assembly protein Flp/PilA